MFESLSSRLQDVFRSLRGVGRVTEASVEAALREVRLGLLEADVNFRVVKAFIERVRERALDAEVMRSLTPDQHVIRIVRDEMMALFGEAAGGLTPTVESPPRVVLLLGLQGSGKTTTAAKLGRWLTTQGHHPLLVSTDVRRPGAIRQLSILAEQAGLRVLDLEDLTEPVDRAERALAEAKQLGFDTVIVDTAGRLHVDDELMRELEAIDRAVAPTDRLYVADAMTGQDAIKSAGEFNHRIGVTGVVLSKMDGDARGGAALSVVSVVGVPIAFVGSGEGLGDLQPFHAERVVSRILGMGDVLSLIEKAEQAITRDEATQLEAKIRRQEFSLGDFRDQLRALTRLGPLDQVLGMIPGLGAMKGLPNGVDEAQITRLGAIIDSMTTQERRRAQIINGSRRQRIARGSGTSVEEVNRLLKQFAQMRKMLKALAGSGGTRRGGKKRRGRTPALDWINP